MRIFFLNSIPILPIRYRNDSPGIKNKKKSRNFRSGIGAGGSKSLLNSLEPPIGFFPEEFVPLLLAKQVQNSLRTYSGLGQHGDAGLGQDLLRR